jgi:hypothetical protein
MTISSKMNDVLRVRSELLTMDVIGKIKGTAFILNALPDILGSNGEAVKVRVSTANYFTVREKGSRSRAKLNDDARSILDRVRNGELAENALTDDQKRTLAQYSGCGGGLKHADGTMGSAYEYYTPKPVAEGVWDALADLGFRGGKVLDPCAGSGIFGATSPTSCVIDAVELSEESALVNKLVNGGPGYTVKNSPFEAVAAATPDEIYDAVVTNVPFGEVADRGENNTKDPKYQNEPLECYFILRSLEKLRPGGMAAFIVPTRCMDGKDGKQRTMRHNASLMAEFIGAYRLPTGTFASADTQTVTDIMFFRKYSRDMKEKIDSLIASNPSVLSESNVVWDEFISGRYYLTPEGKPYVFGTFEAGNGGRWDADKYVYTGNILADFKDLIKRRRLPKSRINWDLLGQAETEPIAYNDGDHITQGGVTLEMRNGVWVQLGESAAPEHDVAKQTMANLASPYKAFESGVTYEQARTAMDVLIAQSAYDRIPDWARTTHNAIRNSRKITEAKREAFWHKAVIATAAQLLVEDRGAEVNYLEEYPELSKAMAENEIKQADIGSVPGVVKAALQVCRGYYTKKAGYSALWRGEIGGNAATAAVADDSAFTPEMKYEALRYRSKSTWNALDEVKAIYGADFDPLASDDWCISADGKSVAKADDVFCGKYKEAIRRIDEDIANAASDEIKYKLIRQKSEAERRVNRLDVSRIHFSLHSPFVTVDEKMAFLRQMVTEDVVIAVDDRGRPYPDIQVRAIRRGITDDEKLFNRFGDYMKNGGIGLGGAKFSGLTEDQALAKLGEMIRKAEAQFDAWARANPTILSRLDAAANDEENLRFRPASDDSTFAVQGMNPALHLHSYQCDFVRKMGREFGGINGFGVGLGKTFSALAAVQHVQSIGVKKKTIFVVPNSVLSNWKKEADFAYASTDDCLFVGLREKRGGKMQADSKFYAEDLQRIRENKHSKIFMTLEAFQMIRLREETLETYLDYMSLHDESYERSESNKENERTNGAKNKILTSLTSGHKAAAPYLEDLGVDSLVIDEAHMYKNSAQIRTFRGAKFLSIASASSRGLDAQAKAWFIRGKNTSEDGVLLLTATPITNSPLEIFSMLSLAVGTQRVNALMGGTRGADTFMETVCEKDEETIEGVDGRERVGQVFKGLNNLAMLRRALGDIATICDAKSVGQSVHVPDGSQQYQTVQLDQTAMERLNKYKDIWHAASRVAAAEEAGRNPSVEDMTLLDENVDRTGEPIDVTKSVFNLISKMTKEIIDTDLVDRVTTYTYPEDQHELAERARDEFEALKITEERFYLPKIVEKSGDYTIKEVQDQVTGNKNHIYLLNVHAHSAEGRANTVQIDSCDPDVQDKFEKVADKLGLALGVSDSPKIAAMLENFKKEQTDPRGVKADGSKASIVKQIIFCDFLGTHNKIKRLLSSRCGVPAGKIAIVTGQKNNKPDQIMEVQDGFNAEEDENKYQVIIANEKAEVGINLQKGTQAIHHLTIGWTPDSIEQRNGRGVRQGNKIDYVNVYYYDADGTFDALKRLMVNKKAGWIEQVTSSDKGDNVRIEGGLSREQLEALANCKTAEDVAKYQQSEEERERQARIANTKRRQAIAIDLVTTQKKFLEEMTDDTVLAAQEVVKALTLTASIADDEAYFEKNAGKEDTPAYKRHINSREGAQKNLEAIFKRLDASVTILRKWQKTPYESAAAAVRSLYNDSPNIRFTIQSINYDIEIVSKGSGPIHDDWVAARAAAERLIHTSSDEFKRYGDEEGGVNGTFIEQLKAGDGRFVDGFCIGEGSFVYFSDYWGDALGVGLPGMSSGRDEGRTSNPYGETVAFLHLDAEKRKRNWETGKDVKRTSEFRVITRVVMPSDGDYEEALKKAAELEDALANEGGQTTPFSQIVPSVKNYRKTAALEYFPYEDVMLPNPYFPYVVTRSCAEGNELCTRIYNEQSKVVKFDSGYGETVGIDTSKCEVEIHRDAGRDSAAQAERVMVFEAFAYAMGKKYPLAACATIGYRRYLTEKRNPEKHVSAYDACKTEEEVDSATEAYIAAELPGLDIVSASLRVVLRILPDVIQDARRKAIERIVAAEKAEQEASISDDDLVDVAGDTYRWKDDLKLVAKDLGETVAWNKFRKVWRVSMRVWRKMIEAHPECVKDIHYEVR